MRQLLAGQYNGNWSLILQFPNKLLRCFFLKNEKNLNLDPLFINGFQIKQSDDTKHLGVTLDSQLDFKVHIEEKLAKARSGLGLMKQLKKWVSYEVLENI